MKVILLTSSVDAVGVSTHILELAKLLNANGILDSVVCPKSGWLSDKLTDINIPFAIVDISFKLGHFIPSSFRLFNFLKNKPKGTIIHIHGRLPLFVSAYTMLRRSDFRFAITIHQFINVGHHGILGWKLKLESFLLHYVHGICCVSRDLEHQVYMRLGRKNKIFVTTIPNWIQPIFHITPHTHQSLTLLKFTGFDLFHICSIGRLSPEKGFDILISAISICYKKGISIHCDIFGDGPSKDDLIALTEKLGVQDLISFKGNVHDVRLQLPKYSSLVVPSRSESFGLVVLEAYDASTVVIASNIAGLRDIVLDGETGILFKSEDSVSLAMKILDVYESRVDIDLLITNSKNILAKHSPNSQLVDCFRNFYHHALNS